MAVCFVGTKEKSHKKLSVEISILFPSRNFKKGQDRKVDTISNLIIIFPPNGLILITKGKFWKEKKSVISSRPSDETS